MGPVGLYLDPVLVLALVLPLVLPCILFGCLVEELKQTIPLHHALLSRYIRRLFNNSDSAVVYMNILDILVLYSRHCRGINPTLSRYILHAPAVRSPQSHCIFRCLAVIPCRKLKGSGPRPFYPHTLRQHFSVALPGTLPQNMALGCRIHPAESSRRTESEKKLAQAQSKAN